MWSVGVNTPEVDANQTISKPMNETLTNFRQAVADSTDLQEKVRGGAGLVALGKENAFDFTQEELHASDEGLTEFELEVLAGGAVGRRHRASSGC